MKKVYKLKSWVKETLLIIGLIILILMVFKITPEEEKAINYCMGQGYSQTHCEHNLFGY